MNAIKFYQQRKKEMMDAIKQKARDEYEKHLAQCARIDQDLRVFFDKLIGPFEGISLEPNTDKKRVLVMLHDGAAGHEREFGLRWSYAKDANGGPSHGSLIDVIDSVTLDVDPRGIIEITKDGIEKHREEILYNLVRVILKEKHPDDNLPF